MPNEERERFTLSLSVLTILTLMISQKPEALESPLIETKANLIIQIRQLKRNYIRQLKNLILDIYEPKNNARHAYYLT